jgi:hypothetical protein
VNDKLYARLRICVFGDGIEIDSVGLSDGIETDNDRSRRR